MHLWHNRIEERFGTSLDFDDTTWFWFPWAWERVYLPAGEDLFRLILDRAEQIGPPMFAMNRGASYRQLAAVCRAFDQINGGQIFYLTVRHAGELIDRPAKSAWRLLRALERDRIIRQVWRGSARKAARYQYLAD